MTGPADPLAEIRASFFIECDELLESLQDGLQAMEDGTHEDETINVVFRAVHSIKGGAGAFGFEDLVSFAHHYETVLDLVRAGTLTPDPGVMRTFFVAADALSDLVRAGREDVSVDPAATHDILERLMALAGDPPENDAEIEFQPMSLSLDLAELGDEAAGSASAPAAREFTIRFRPHVDLYGTGNEPLHILRSLSRMGVAQVSLEAGDVPELTQWSDEAANLAWTITLRTDTDRPMVEEAFEFVTDLCDLEIVESEAPASGTPPLPPSSAALPPAPDPSDLDWDGDAIREDTKARQGTPEDSNGVAPGVPPAAAASARQQPAATVRVGLDRIDRLMNLVGELVINQAMLSQSARDAGVAPNSDLAQGLDAFMQLTRDIQDSVMTIRAQPVKSLFQRMSRIVREASSELGKSVRLQTLGEMTEVDKTVIERLADPLTHMIRNAVDHGLEPDDVRIASGKPREGTVTLSAAHQSGRVIIEVADDGAGIDRDRVLAKAVSKGLVPADLAILETEIDNLLFLPGFSTASQVSALSGRGVGMDVVKTAIQSLGGRIAITSQRGAGTRFSISLPLTLAVLDGMVVEVAGETLIMPLGAVVETMILTRQNLRQMGQDSFVVEIRGGFAPLIDLGVSLGYRAGKPDYSGAIVLVIGLEDGSRSTVVVDSIQDQRQVVIKGLQSVFGAPPGIAAATILGDGRVALILDPLDLTRVPATNSAFPDAILKTAS